MAKNGCPGLYIPPFLYLAHTLVPVSFFKILQSSVQTVAFPMSVLFTLRVDWGLFSGTMLSSMLIWVSKKQPNRFYGADIRLVIIEIPRYYLDRQLIFFLRSIYLF